MDENKKINTDEVVDTDAIMQEFDRESNVRVFTGWRKVVMTCIMAGFSAYMLSMALMFQTASKFTKLTTFLAFVVFIGYLVFPAYKKQTKKINYVPFYDIILAVVGAGSFLYYTFNQVAIQEMRRRLGTVEIIVAIIAIVLLVELCRRAVGLPIIFVAGAFVAYGVYERITANPETALRSLIYNLFYDVDNGIFSSPIYVCTTFIVLFIILGAILEKTGIGTFFVDLANSIAGSSVGGPAKVAVISSALEGMYSGSSVANTVGSGSVTIPLMKKTGYKPEFAAAVEAAASTGGQIMPPIMGAAAFLMVEMTDTPYSKIAISAILPAVLYFMGIFLMIHFEAKKLGLKGLPKDALPNFFKLIIKNGYLLLPIVVLVIAMNYLSAGLSACLAILAALIVSLFPKKLTKSNAWKIIVPVIPVAVLLALWIPNGRAGLSTAIFVSLVLTVLASFVVKNEATLSPKLIVESFESGAKNTIGVAVACGMAGIISGVVTMTALGGVLVKTLVPLAENSTFLALFLTMICCIVLGMGVPTTANYIIMATITAPILVKMGIPMLAAHMFVFYFGIVADITPPVALAAYAGSAIAKSNPMKTGITATRLAITAFIVPYIFAYSPQMLFIDTKWYEVVLIVITAIVGIYGVSAAMEGYMNVKMPWWQRILCLAGGLLCIVPGVVTDAIGFALISVVLVLQYLVGRKEKLPTKNKIIAAVVIVIVAVLMLIPYLDKDNSVAVTPTNATSTDAVVSVQ